MRTNDRAQDMRGQSVWECCRPGGLGLTRRGLELCAFPAQARIADIGCGAGASVRLLRALGYNGLGVDLCRPAGGFPAVQGKAQALPLARAGLHGIVCECVLSLLHQPRDVLKGFWTACRPGGRLLLTDLYQKAEAPGPSNGPLARRQLEEALHKTGWRVLHFEDCQNALKDFAAQCLWHAEDAAPPWPRALWDAGLPWRALSYGLWVAQKEEA